MIRKRTFTVTYEYPEELFNALEEKAKQEERPLIEVIVEHENATRFVRPPVSREEEERLHQELLSLFGTGTSDDPHSSNNERIDADLAQEFGSGRKP